LSAFANEGKPLGLGAGGIESDTHHGELKDYSSCLGNKQISSWSPGARNDPPAARGCVPAAQHTEPSAFYRWSLSQYTALYNTAGGNLFFSDPTAGG
jgi:hypothetical protein